jgi:hypothetical protein
MTLHIERSMPAVAETAYFAVGKDDFVVFVNDEDAVVEAIEYIESEHASIFLYFRG